MKYRKHDPAYEKTTLWRPKQSPLPYPCKFRCQLHKTNRYTPTRTRNTHPNKSNVHTNTHHRIPRFTQAQQRAEPHPPPPRTVCPRPGSHLEQNKSTVIKKKKQQIKNEGPAHTGMVPFHFRPFQKVVRRGVAFRQGQLLRTLKSYEGN